MILINIGVGCMTDATKILTVIKPESSPVKRLMQTARENNKLIDATYGKRTRSVIVCDNDQLILSSMTVETIADRMMKGAMDI